MRQVPCNEGLGLDEQKYELTMTTDSRSFAGLRNTHKHWRISFVGADAYFPFGTALAPKRSDRQFPISVPLFIHHEVRRLDMRVDRPADRTM